MPVHTALGPDDPSRIDEYLLISRLGEGGQGVVYLAETPSGERVVVKLLRTAALGNPAARTLLAREVNAARAVARFCTAQVIEARLDRDPPFVVSEYVDGPTLEEHVTDHGPLAGAALDRLAVGTATALASIHQSRIVHRDFKPGNVVLGPDGVRVIDFGIAHDLVADADATAPMLGTPAFLSPEQARSGPVGPAADMFAWASTMVFAATGYSPFEAGTAVAQLHRVVTADPDLTGVPQPLAEVLVRCLAKDPAARPTAEQVLLHLLGAVSRDSGTGAPRSGTRGDELARAAAFAGSVARTARTAVLSVPSALSVSSALPDPAGVRGVAAALFDPAPQVGRGTAPSGLFQAPSVRSGPPRPAGLTGTAGPAVPDDVAARDAGAGPGGGAVPGPDTAPDDGSDVAVGAGSGGRGPTAGYALVPRVAVPARAVGLRSLPVLAVVLLVASGVLVARLANDAVSGTGRTATSSGPGTDTAMNAAATAAMTSTAAPGDSAGTSAPDGAGDATLPPDGTAPPGGAAASGGASGATVTTEPGATRGHPGKTRPGRAGGGSAPGDTRTTSAASATTAPGTSPSGGGGTAAVTVPSRFAGEWTGAVTQPPGAPRIFPVTVSLTAGAVGGSMTLPTLGCSARLDVVALSGDRRWLTLAEQVTSDPENRCALAATVTLSVARGGALGMVWQDASDPANTAAGRLVRS